MHSAAMRALMIASAALFAVAGVVHAQAPSADPVVEAERAFARDGLALSINASFNKWAEPGAILIAGGQASTVEAVYPPDQPRPADEPNLEWWPNFAGISRSGDLGFTTGGVAVNGQRAGHYFTIWRKQADESWRWVYDGGSGASAADVPGPESAPVVLPPSTSAPTPSAEAVKQVAELEASLATEARIDQAAAHLRRVSASSRVYVAPRPPAIGLASIQAALRGWPVKFAFGPAQGGGASSAGDLVWTYGEAAWEGDGQALKGHYVRLWQRQEAGFKIVLAQLIPAPPPQAATASN